MQSDLFSSLRFYMEGAEKIGDVELARMNISMISDTQLHTIVDQAKLPTPFGNAIIDNVTNKAFADSGITTLGDYFDTTIFNVIINIISILIIFIILRVILTLVTNAFSYAYKTASARAHGLSNRRCGWLGQGIFLHVHALCGNTDRFNTIHECIVCNGDYQWISMLFNILLKQHTAAFRFRSDMTVMF